MSRRDLVRAAVLVAGLTVLARAFGALRVVVLARTVGPTCLGDVYAATNTLPTVLFETAAGGALAGLVVPLVAARLGRDDDDLPGARRVVGALLLGALVVLGALAVLVAATVPLLAAALVGDGPAGCPPDAVGGVARRMLWVFTPQVVLYGMGVVLVGALQAQRRFVGPALAPLLSSAVVVVVYLLVGARTDAAATGLVDLSLADELLLSVGTTLGVVALTLPLLVPLARSPLGLAAVRPVARPPAGLLGEAGRLAGAGAAVLAGQQVFLLVALAVAARGPVGDALVVQLVWTVVLVPWAVLAVPVATAAFPELSRARGREFAALLAPALRAVLLLAVLPAAALVAAARPVARTLLAAAPGPSPTGDGAGGPAAVDRLADGLVALAPALVGLGVLALGVRALLALRAAAPAALAGGAGWAVSLVGLLVAVGGLGPADSRVVVVGAACSAGLLLGAVALVGALRRAAGPAAVAGSARTAVVALLGAVAGVVAGRLLDAVLDDAGPVASLGHAALVSLVTLGVALAVVLPLDGRAALAAVRAGRRRDRQQGPTSPTTPGRVGGGPR